MPIRRRLREDYWLVSRDDDALDELDPRSAATYARTYDYRIIERYLAEHPDKRPTRFRAKPLAVEWQDRAGNLTPTDCWRLFTEHVTAIENLLDENGAEIRIEPKGDGAKRIPDKWRENGSLDMQTFVEIASAIYARGTTADNVPFGSPDTSLEWQRRRGWQNRVREMDAALLIGSASAKTSPPSESSPVETADGSSRSDPSTGDGE